MLKFVNRLTDDQLHEYLNDNLNKHEYVSNICKGDNYYVISYDNTQSDYWCRKQCLYDDKTQHDQDYDPDWMMYLYSIFGDEYRQWYTNKLLEQISEIFDSEELE